MHLYIKRGQFSLHTPYMFQLKCDLKQLYDNIIITNYLILLTFGYGYKRNRVRIINRASPRYLALFEPPAEGRVPGLTSYNLHIFTKNLHD